MASESEIAGVYEGFLEKQSNNYLAGRLTILAKTVALNLEDYERTQLISIIQNVDWTGKLDGGFEDLRKSISTNDGCG